MNDEHIDPTAAALARHEAVCEERYDAVKKAIDALRESQKRLFSTQDDIVRTLGTISGKVGIIEAVMLALLALGIYEVLVRPVFQ